MALELSLSVVQSNDATYLTITDDTGAYSVTTNPTGWGSPNEEVTDVVVSTDDTAGKHHLLLDITVTDKDGTETEYDTINLYDHDSTGSFAVVGDLTWIIDAADLVDGSTAMGTATDLLTDGVYEITYTLQDANTAVAVDTYEETVLINGGVRIETYDALREISRQYDDEVNNNFREINETLLKYSYLQAMDAADTTSQQDEIINMLWTLDKLNSDGSKYSW